MGPGGGLTNTLVLIACIYFSGKIDFTDADNVRHQSGSFFHFKFSTSPSFIAISIARDLWNCPGANLGSVWTHLHENHLDCE